MKCNSLISTRTSTVYSKLKDSIWTKQGRSNRK